MTPLLLLLLAGIAQPALAQSPSPGAITGLVTGPQGEPVSSVTVGVQVADGATVTVNFQLQTQAIALEGIVAVGYSTQRKASLTGSVAAVTASELTRFPATTTSAALAGKVPGVLTRQADSRPGNGAALQIRNLGAPLYVIDGIPKDEGQFNQLNVNDIESISILKDASAAAIYGVRAANGVVLVTTKKGQRGQASHVEVTSYFGIQDLVRFPRPANAVDFVTAQIESDVNLQGRTGWTPADLEKWKAGTEYGYRPFDWYDFAVQKHVPQRSWNASFSGGSDQINYYLSIGRLNQDAVWKDFTFERTNIQANVDANIVDRLKVGAQVNGRVESRINPGLPGVDDYFRPIFGILRQLPTERPYANDNPNYPALTSDGASNWATLNYGISGTFYNKWRVGQANFTADYATPIEGLKAAGRYSYYLADNMEETFEYTYDLYRYDPVTGQYYVAGGNQNPYRDRWNRKVEEHLVQLQLNYNKMFGRHELGVVTVFESTQRQNPVFQVRSQPATNYIPLMNFNELRSMVHVESEEARKGFAFRANYNYDNRYLLEIAGRYDGSWKFPPGKRWGLFPSASVGWRVSNEAFYQRSGFSNILNELKLRASYGTLGDDDANLLRLGPFDYLDGYNFRQGSAVFDGAVITGAQPRGLPVRNISWLRSTMTNVGVDFALLGNALSGSIDGFYRKRTGLPAARWDVLLPAEVAIALPNENLNADAHMGIEGALSFSRPAGHRLRYTLGANATFSRQRDLYTYKPRFGNSWDEYRNSTENRWAFINWGYQVIGQFQSQDEIDKYPVDVDGRNNTTLLPGDFIFKDVNRDGIINELDERPIGFRQGALPYMSFGFNASASYGAFDLSLNFAGSAFQSFERVSEMKVPFWNNANSPAYMFRDRWRREDPFDRNSAWIPGKYPLARRGVLDHSNLRKSDFWVTNVSYLRLQSLALGFTLPPTLQRRLRVSDARVFVNGKNLLVLDNVGEFGIDPELASGNGLQYPQLREITIGVSLGLSSRPELVAQTAER
ncbi:MAG: hypothetical protein AUG74_17475 [Bacteroidetes bacterium 13_1_20CM_4_60_6]|nr:MAG: hypothetical protein AUG74_17475 [Bacteroidetes bacterium 13_1_20CM_4_60_6]